MFASDSACPLPEKVSGVNDVRVNLRINGNSTPYKFRTDTHNRIKSVSFWQSLTDIKKYTEAKIDIIARHNDSKEIISTLNTAITDPPIILKEGMTIELIVRTNGVTNGVINVARSEKGWINITAIIQCDLKSSVIPEIKLPTINGKTTNINLLTALIRLCPDIANRVIKGYYVHMKGDMILIKEMDCGRTTSLSQLTNGSLISVVME